MKGNYFDLDSADYNFANIILVEGQDDAFLLEIVLNLLGIPPREARIIVCKGKSGFGKHIPLIVKSIPFAKKIRSLSIIRDADEDYNSALREVHGYLRRENLPLPDVSDFVDSEGKRVGVYFFPRPQENGDLESLAIELATASEELSETLQFIDSARSRNPDLNKISKRKIQVYLGGVSQEIRPTVGWAFRDGTIPISLEVLPELTSFMRSVLIVE